MRNKPFASILGGGIATALLKGLNKRKIREVSRYQSNGAQLDFSLRYCYQNEHGRWDGFSYVTRTVATGGMVLQAWGNAIPELALQPYRRSYHLKPHQVKRAQWYLGCAITRMAREWGVERVRQRYVQMVDSAAKPFIADQRFIEAVHEQEKTWGESDYGTMSQEQCSQWLEWIDTWKKGRINRSLDDRQVAGMEVQS